jgi:hypothetical protein
MLSTRARHSISRKDFLPNGEDAKCMKVGHAVQFHLRSAAEVTARAHRKCELASRIHAIPAHHEVVGGWKCGYLHLVVIPN